MTNAADSQGRLLLQTRVRCSYNPHVQSHASKSVRTLKIPPELRRCVKVEVDVLGSSPNKPTVSVDVKQLLDDHHNF